LKAVLDTNILISALISATGTPHQIYRAWLASSFTLVTSEQQLEEFKEVCSRPQIRKFVKPIEVGNFVNAIRKRAVILEAYESSDVSSDPDDNYLFGMAFTSGAAFIVSVDREHVLSVGKVKGVTAITPSAFLKHFKPKRKKRPTKKNV
jgi:uncharacterized protein